MPEIIFKTGTGTFSGDISANDASFNDVDIKGLNIYDKIIELSNNSVNENLGMNNLEIKTDLNDNDPLIKYVSGNSYIWSDNNVEEVANNDASFNVVVWRRVSASTHIVSSEIQLFIGNVNILPSDYVLYNSGNFNGRATSGYKWNSKELFRLSDGHFALETSLFNSNFTGFGRTNGPSTDNSIIIFLKSSHNIRDIQSIVVYGQLANGTPSTGNSNAQYNNGTILELYNDTNDVNLNNPLLSTHKIDDTHLYHAYRWDFPAIINYNNFSSSLSTTQIYNGNVYKFTTNYIDSNLFFEVPNNTSIDNVHILPNPNESDVSLNKYNLIAPVPTQTFNVVVWRRVISPHHIVSSEIQLFIGNVNILPSDYEVYNDGGFSSRATSGYRWNSKTLYRGPSATTVETSFFDSNFTSFGDTTDQQPDNSIIIFLKSSHNIRDIQSIVVYGQLVNGTPNTGNTNAQFNNGTILELYNDTNDVNLNNPLLSTNMIDDTHLYNAYRWDFPALNEYTFGFASSPSTTQICDNNVYKFTTNYSNYLFDIKYLYSPITPTYINNIQSIITDKNLVLYSDDTSFDYYSNKEGIKRFDFANIGSYTKDFSNNDLTNYIPKGETTIAVSPKITTLYNNGLMGVTTFKDNVNINGDLQVNSDLHISGSIGNNLDVIGNLNVGGYIKQRTASWSLGGAAFGNSSQSQINGQRFKWSGSSAPEINCFYESDDSNTKKRSIVIEIPGRYYISASFLSNQVSGNFIQHIQKNGVVVLILFEQGYSNYHNSVAGSIILDLVVGDYVSILNSGKVPIHEMLYNSFCGYLIG